MESLTFNYTEYRQIIITCQFNIIHKMNDNDYIFYESKESMIDKDIDLFLSGSFSQV